MAESLSVKVVSISIELSTLERFEYINPSFFYLFYFVGGNVDGGVTV